MSLLLSQDDILKEVDHYKILGVLDSCSFDDISTAYKKLAKLYHPDRLSPSEKDKGNSVFSKITVAYNILKDSEKRSNYDYEKVLKKEYEKTMSIAKKAFSDSGTVEKSTSKTGGFTLSSAINYTKVYNYDSHVSPTSNTINNHSTTTNQKPENSTLSTQKSEEAERMYNEALEKYKAGNIDAAILDLQTATVLRKAAKYYSALGLFMREKGWHGYAQVEFKKALAIDPKDSLANKYMDEYEQKKDEIRQNASKNQVNSAAKKGLFAAILDFISKLFSKK